MHWQLTAHAVQRAVFVENQAVGTWRERTGGVKRERIVEERVSHFDP